MKLKHLFLIVFLFVSSVSIFSQDDGAKGFWKKVKIRKGFESKDDNSKPAVLSLTFPKDTASSYLINGGISFRLYTIKHKKDSKSTKMIFEPFFVFNRNTLIDAEQFNYKLGISNNWKLGQLDKKERKLNYFSLSNAVEYMRDKIDSSHSGILTSYLTSINSSSKKGSFYINTPKPIGKKGFFYFLTWAAGIEYQNVFESKDKNEEGSRLRGYYNTGFRIFKKIDPLGIDNTMGNKFIEIDVNYTGRYDFINSTSVKEGYLPLFKAELLIYPAMNDRFSIGFSYNSGSDPLNGLADQNFYQLALKFQK